MTEKYPDKMSYLQLSLNHLFIDFFRKIKHWIPIGLPML